MGANSSTPHSIALAESLCAVGKELSVEDSMMILRLWKETVLEKEKLLRSHVKGSTKRSNKFSLSSEISKADFMNIFETISQTEQFSEMYPILTKKNTLEHLFIAFDTDNSGTMTLEEFVSGLSVFSSGSFQQKAEMVFRSYDINNNSSISRSELTKSIRKTIRGGISTLKKEEPNLSPEEMLKITGKMDEASVQRTVDYILTNCSSEREEMKLSDWLNHCETDKILCHVLTSIISPCIKKEEGKSDFSLLFPIHPTLLSCTSSK